MEKYLFKRRDLQTMTNDITQDLFKNLAPTETLHFFDTKFFFSSTIRKYT